MLIQNKSGQHINPAKEDGNLADIKTALEILDNIVSGNEAQVDVITSALPSGASTSAKQDTQTAEIQKLIGFEIPAYDYISLGYTGDNLTTVVYKTGGSGGTTVATLTLAYTGSQLDSVTKT